jgi:hypothetical protein
MSARANPPSEPDSTEPAQNEELKTPEWDTRVQTTQFAKSRENLSGLRTFAWYFEKFFFHLIHRAGARYLLIIVLKRHWVTPRPYKRVQTKSWGEW